MIWTRRRFTFSLLAPHFPRDQWESREPSSLGLKPEPLEQLATNLGGRGCVIRSGYVVKQWGSQSEKADVLSSAKPVLSTLLFFAVHERKLKSVDSTIASFGWDLEEKDRGMTFRHLACMTSGYARPEPAGAAWAYNDFAIQLYQKTLFDKVYRDDPRTVAMDPRRLGALGLEDGLEFRATNRRMSASVRDFARVAWFWLQQGRWNGKQVLPRGMFQRYRKPHVPANLPHTAKAETRDYLKIGSYGGGSDHFTEYGAGIYGFNWWFNSTGRLHRDQRTWPDAPADAFMSIGAGGNCSVMLPGLNMVLVCARGDWGTVKAGDPEWKANRHMKLLVDAARS